MKSPLVDALRLASGKDKAANSEQAQPVAETQQAADNAAGVDAKPTLLDAAQAEVPELSLMDATGVLVVQSAEDGDDEFATSQVIAEEAVNEADVDQVAIGEDAVNKQAVDDAPAPRAPAPVTAIANHRRMPGLARLGSFSPLICLLLASAATGSYFLYQSAGGELQGAGLGMLAPDLGASSAAGAVIDPGGPINRFPLTGVATQSRPTPPTSQRSQSVVSPAAINPERVPVTTSKTTGLDDRAFAALNEAYTAYESGEVDASEAAYRRALELAPRHPNGLHGLAAILHRTGRVDEALGYYETLLSVEPGNTEAAAALLAGRSSSGSPATESEIKVLLQRHPDSAHLHYALGTFMAQQDRWADARLAYYKALAIDPKNPEYQFNLAVSLENLGQFDDARVRYESVLANISDASVIDSQLVSARIEMLAQRSSNRGGAQ